jgi:hypothetical protein
VPHLARGRAARVHDVGAEDVLRPPLHDLSVVPEGVIEDDGMPGPRHERADLAAVPCREKTRPPPFERFVQIDLERQLRAPRARVFHVRAVLVHTKALPRGVAAVAHALVQPDELPRRAVAIDEALRQIGPEAPEEGACERGVVLDAAIVVAVRRRVVEPRPAEAGPSGGGDEARGVFLRDGIVDGEAHAARLEGGGKSARAGVHQVGREQGVIWFHNQIMTRGRNPSRARARG